MSHTSRVLGCLALAIALVWPAVAGAGTITAYTALEEDDVKIYLEAFNKDVPDVKVNVLRLSTGDLIARILAEKSNPRHVIWAWPSPMSSTRASWKWPNRTSRRA
jgi:iron(III) transport system substrate-binding protein